MALELTIKVKNAYGDGHKPQRVETVAVEPSVGVELAQD
jgi:hypothetical protein